MDSLAAPQDRLVEQLLSPRTQAQRRLKVCVERGVECGSACVCLPVPVPRALGRDRDRQGQGPPDWALGPRGWGRLGAAVYK